MSESSPGVNVLKVKLLKNPFLWGLLPALEKWVTGSNMRAQPYTNSQQQHYRSVMYGRPSKKQARELPNVLTHIQQNNIIQIICFVLLNLNKKMFYNSIVSSNNSL